MTRTRALLALAALLPACGDPTSANNNPPAIGNVLAISAGGNHTCALRIDGKAFCWGANTFGQLGDGTQEDRLQPVAVAGGLSFVGISAGDQHTCALTGAGDAYCWGDNVQGQVGGNSDAQVVTTPLLAATRTFSQLSAGQDHTCGISAGVIACWGTGYLGDDSTNKRRPYPVEVPGGPYSLVSAATNYTCALRATGAAYCWGVNAGGLLGNGSTSGESATPVVVAGSHRFTELDAGVNHACAIETNGATYCWGTNANGQLGTGATGSPTGTPVAVEGAPNFTAVASGEDYTCATTGTEVYCWGRNAVGQLGISDNTVHPSVTLSEARVSSVSSFRLTTCGVNDNFYGYCWGANAFGQAGTGGTSAAVALPFRITLPAP